MSEKSWKVLLVNDDISLHETIQNLINDIVVFGKKLNVLYANNAQEAQKILQKHTDITVAFIDIAMETPDAGLKLVKYTRETLQNHDIRICLVDSGDSPLPAHDIIEHYDINDFTDKICIQSTGFFTVVRTAIKQYQQFKALQKSKEEIYKKMTTNEVTGLPNRMKLSEKLDSQGNKSLILINIDDFALFNDNYSFSFGDTILKAFAQFLVQKHANKMDIFHLEADVFALLCYEVDLQKLEECIKDIKEEITTHLFEINGVELYLTASLGVVLNENGNIIQKAEFALKEARLYGKNNLSTYREDLHIIETINANSKWSQILREAFLKNKVYAYFQPIVDIKTKKIIKYEALVRLEHEGKIHSPFLFLGAALYSGQIFDIFRFMFEEVCKKIDLTKEKFSLNLSEYDLKMPKLIPFIDETIQKYKVDPSQITFEILEHTSISHDEKFQKVINSLHVKGFQIAIDDFGAECSNFAQLHNLHIDLIKIDAGFIKNIVTDKNSQIVTKTILDYAHQKDIPVAAEFVCSQEIYNYLAKIGVDYAQGYYISEPKPELS